MSAHYSKYKHKTNNIYHMAIYLARVQNQGTTKCKVDLKNTTLHANMMALYATPLTSIYQCSQRLLKYVNVVKRVFHYATKFLENCGANTLYLLPTRA
jgi:hypothetical protein